MVPSNKIKKPEQTQFDQVSAFIEPLTIYVDLAGGFIQLLTYQENQGNAGNLLFPGILKKLTR